MLAIQMGLQMKVQCAEASPQQLALFRFLTSTCDRGTSFQMDRNLPKAPMFPSILAPLLPSWILSTLRIYHFEKHGLLLLGTQTQEEEQAERTALSGAYPGRMSCKVLLLVFACLDSSATEQKWCWHPSTTKTSNKFAIHSGDYSCKVTTR